MPVEEIPRRLADTQERECSREQRNDKRRIDYAKPEYLETNEEQHADDDETPQDLVDVRLESGFGVFWSPSADSPRYRWVALSFTLAFSVALLFAILVSFPTGRLL